MGGNGARSAYLAEILDRYAKERFLKIVMVEDEGSAAFAIKRTGPLVNGSSFARIYYIGGTQECRRVENIAFYNKKGELYAIIDLEYTPGGEPAPYSQLTKRGSHIHRCAKTPEGTPLRICRSEDNLLIGSYYMQFVKRALQYNETKS